MGAKAPNIADLTRALAGKRQERMVVSELLEQLMDAFGGAKGLAQEFRQVFRQASQGGIVRARMLDGILRLVTLHTANLKGKDGDLGTLSDAEIERELRDHLDGAPHGAVEPATEEEAGPGTAAAAADPAAATP